MSEKEKLIARLSTLDSCAISDALDSLDQPPAVSGIRCLAGQPSLTGRIMTVRLGTDPPQDGSKRHLCTGAIDSAQAGDVIVVEQNTGIDAAGWGGVLSNAAKVKGLAGTIVEGPTRDIDESAEIGYTLFARATTARTARGRIYEQAFNCPVTVGEVKVSPGDYVYADSSAVVFISADRLEEVIEAAERITEKERLMTQAVLSGQPASEVMGADYESMLDKDN